MKNKIILIIVMFVSTISFGQTQIDALRFSQIQYGGTARFVAMGSSFGALGADLSAMAINPAGIALYRGGEFNFTPGIMNDQVNSSFSGTNRSSLEYGFLFNNIGFAIGFNDDSNTSDWKGVGFGFSYNRLQNFRQNIVIEGTNDVASMISLFVDNANIQDPAGTSHALNSFYEYPAWQCFLIDYDPGASEYWSPVTDAGIYGQTQRKSIRRQGGIGEYDFTFGVNYNDLLYIGGTLGIQSVNFHEASTYKESDFEFTSTELTYTSPDTSYSYTLYSPNFFSVDEDLRITGSGVNLKLGMIFRPIDWVRVGAAFHTPTFLSLTDNYETSFYARYDYELPDNFGTDVDYTTRYDDAYKYDLRTPSRFIGSLGFIIMKMAVVNIEYEYVDYSKAMFNHYQDDFTPTNQAIQNEFVAASNIRAGAEFRLGPVSFRGGFGMYGNPYASKLNRIDATQFVYSGGLGLTGGNFYVDFAYSLTAYEDNYFMYNGYTDEPVPTLDLKKGIGMVTFGVKF